jgi:hypothetical protein
MKDASKSKYLGNVLRARAVCTEIEGLERRLFFAGDATPPTVVAADFVFDAFPVQQTISITFSENVHRSIDEQDIHLENLTTGVTIPASELSVHADGSTNAVSITFADGDGSSGGRSKTFPDGNYHLTLPAGSVEDNAGNPLETTFTFDFFVLAGDANRDRVVDVADLGILATNWQNNQTTFSLGDFSYNGRVDVTDLGILATNWQKSLPAPAARVFASAPTVQLTPSVTSNRKDATVLDQIDEL